MLIQEYFKTRIDLLEQALDKYLTPADEYPQELHEAMRYSVFSGGKRLRPILFLGTYEMLLGRKNINRLERLMPAACALEFVHTASLIHDDLPSIDNAPERRGMPSCHVKFGTATAILAGDALITKAVEILTEINNKKVALNCIQIITKAMSTRGMIGGQAVDILSSKKKITINTLRYINLKKTGALLQASVELACAIFGAEENVAITLGNFSLNIGLAYQIVDDILDEVGSFEILGKEPGEDYRNNKSTYPALLGLEKAKKTAEKLLRDSYNLVKNMPNNDVLVEYVNMIKERLP
ncbi:MAG: polyprenyl synthetase family protein [Candidatus Cloacimonadales bacterium]|nr:polyprenyl synthetase family protein [Candidatus Cloacimonadales bacterium]